MLVIVKMLISIVSKFQWMMRKTGKSGGMHRKKISIGQGVSNTFSSLKVYI